MHFVDSCALLPSQISDQKYHFFPHTSAWLSNTLLSHFFQMPFQPIVRSLAGIINLVRELKLALTHGGVFRVSFSHCPSQDKPG